MVHEAVGVWSQKQADLLGTKAMTSRKCVVANKVPSSMRDCFLDVVRTETSNRGEETTKVQLPWCTAEIPRLFG